MKTFSIISTFPYKDNFETNSTGKYSTSGSSHNLWQWGKPTYPGGPSETQSGTNCWGINLSGVYENNESDYLLLPIMDLTDPGITNAILSFYTWFDTDAGRDGGNITFSTDNRSNWHVLDNDPTEYEDESVAALGYTNGFSGVGDAWNQVFFNMKFLTGKKVFLRFNFKSDWLWSGYPGWYIDDLEIKTSDPVPPDVKFIDAKKIFITPDGKEVEKYTTYGIELVDLDLDEDLDLIDAAYGYSYNYVYKNDINNNKTNFIQKSSAGTFNTFKMRTGDFDNDGDLDALALNCIGDQDDPATFGDDSIFGAKQNYIILNNSKGKFSIGQDFLEDKTRDAAIGDFDNDGDLDVFVANIGPNKLLINKGNGEFIESATILPGGRSTCVKLGDLDNDGDLDAVLGHWGYDEFNMVLVNENGRFKVVGTNNRRRLGSDNTISCDLGDVNADGYLDVLFGTLKGMHIWTNNGNAEFGKSSENPFKAQRNPSIVSNIITWGVAFGDVDNDGDLDIYSANYGHEDFLWINKSSGRRFQAEENNYEEMGEFRSRDLSLGDIDKDGRLDFVVANSGLQKNKVWLNKYTNTNNNYINTPPQPPSSVSVSFSGNNATITWNNDASDTETTPNLLTYNLRIGLTPDGNEILSCPGKSIYNTRSGNIGQGKISGSTRSWTIVNLTNISYHYFSIQTVDSGFLGSGWKTVDYYHDPNAPAVDDFTVSDNFLKLNEDEKCIIIPNLGKASTVTIKIINLEGAVVETLWDNLPKPAGYFTDIPAIWYGKNTAGNKIAPGIYWVVVKTESWMKMKRVLVIW